MQLSLFFRLFIYLAGPGLICGMMGLDLHCCLVTKSCLFVTPWTVARQAPLSTGFPRQEYWSGLPLPSPGDLPDPGIKLRSPALQVDFLLLSHWGNQSSLWCANS